MSLNSLSEQLTGLDSLEARIEARRRQAREREITEKAIAVAGEYGNHSKSWSDEKEKCSYVDDKIEISCSKVKRYEQITNTDFESYNQIIWTNLEIKTGHQVYHDEFAFFLKEKYDGKHFISTYAPGDWETHLDGLYKRIPEHRNERIQREIQREQEEQEIKRRQEFEAQKRCFGL